MKLIWDVLSVDQIKDMGLCLVKPKVVGHENVHYFIIVKCHGPTCGCRTELNVDFNTIQLMETLPWMRHFITITQLLF